MRLEVVLFVVGLLGITYSYFIYPTLLVLILKLKKTSSQITENKVQSLPKLSFIITAYNEERSIAQKIENTLAADYPQTHLEILVASDGSTDNTNQIVKSFADKGVRLVEVVDRLGKENAQKQAIGEASGEIIVFSDVSTRIETHALQRIAAVFENPSVGAISSEDRFLSQDGTVVGEGAYVKYEMWLRGLESRFNSLVGLSGSFFAARKTVCETWDISVPSDFNTALNTVSKGLRAVSDPELLGFYPDIKSSNKEYARKLRTVIRGMAALFAKSEVMNPIKYGVFSFQVISHKLMRWLVPWFMVISLLTNLILIGEGWVYQLTLFGQIALYLAALIGWLVRSTQSFTPIKLSFFFVQVNLAIAHATVMYLTGQRITKWEPSKR